MEWIKAIDKLPREDDFVLIWYNDEPQKVYRDGHEWHWMDKDQFTPVRDTEWCEITPPEDDHKTILF